MEIQAALLISTSADNAPNQIHFLNTDNLIILANEIANEDIKIEIP
jgi:hypothetical protein